MRASIENEGKGRDGLDAVTFQKEVKKSQKLLFRIAWSYMGCLQDVEDMVQEAIETAWEKRTSLRDEHQFGSWLSRILVNKCKNTLRKRKIMSFFPLDEGGVTEGEPTDKIQMTEALNSLQPELRLVLTLHYYDCYSMREISQMLGIPLGTVQTRMMRGRKKLKYLISVEWEEEQ